MEGNLDIGSLALSMNSCLVQFDERNFVWIGYFLLNWLHVDDNLFDDSLYGLFYLVKVSRRSCKPDFVRHYKDLSLVILLKNHHKLRVSLKFVNELLFLLLILQGIKTNIFTFELQLLSFLFDVFFFSIESCKLFEQ